MTPHLGDVSPSRRRAPAQPQRAALAQVRAGASVRFTGDRPLDSPLAAGHAASTPAASLVRRGHERSAIRPAAAGAFDGRRRGDIHAPRFV